MKVRIGTFNAENLFARFQFKSNVDPEEAIREGWTVEDTKFDRHDYAKRRITGRAIKAVKADIMGLQEVEGMDALKSFASNHLKGQPFRHKILIDGNDPRRIDVAVLSRFEIAAVRTHQHRRTAGRWLFSRDCLEVDVRIPSARAGDELTYGAKTLPIFVNHFKSMMGGRDETMARRREQAEGVVDILKARFGPDPGQFDWVVLGDLNDYLPSAGLAPLLGQPWLENVVARIGDAKDRWTHYYASKRQYSQLDYILLSSSLARKDPGAVPVIERRGMPTRATRFAGTRFPGVGESRPKASDHCPVVIELDV